MEMMQQLVRPVLADAIPSVARDLSRTPGPAWPMPVDEFLAGTYLRPSDVVLTRKRNSIRSWLIRIATRGSFSHAALVFLVPRLEKGFDSSFVIEAASNGVGLTNLADYLNNRRTIVGIKRLDKPWFTEELQCLVRGRLLNSIKSPYCYATLFTILRDTWNELRYGMRSCVFGSYKAITKSRRLQLTPPNQYICSGLVQMGFLDVVADLAFNDRIAPEHINDVVFRDDLAKFLPQDWTQFTQKEQREIIYDYASGFADHLQSVTPNDLARSASLTWAYVVRDGEVHEVQNDRHAKALLNWRWRGNH